ncbi:MAG: hypothetical protein HY231_23625 [Acidobacteria bacterium]|nr:hypothetical protein [Acidobacteriota bacterium]
MASKQPKKNKRGRPSQGLHPEKSNVRLFQGQPERIEKLARRLKTDSSVIHRIALELGLVEMEQSDVVGNISDLVKAGIVRIDEEK